jgi:hypothetical protein
MNVIEQLLAEGYNIAGKHTKIRIIASSSKGYVFQVSKNNHILLYQGSDEDRVREVFLENESGHNRRK